MYKIPWALCQHLDSDGTPIVSGVFEMHLMLILTFSYEFWRVDRGKPVFILFPASHFFHSLQAKFKDKPMHGPKERTKEVTKVAKIHQQSFTDWEPQSKIFTHLQVTIASWQFNVHFLKKLKKLF